MCAAASPAPYDAIAGVYDELTSHNDYELWLGGHLLPLLTAYGLVSAGSVLDVGCGTGRGFPPLTERGWSVTGCDLSQRMIERARAKLGPRADLHLADMRELPRLGAFDLVLILNDSLNHVLGDGDLERTMHGVARNLRPGGLLLFDCNSRSVFEQVLGAGQEQHVELDGRGWTWKGLGHEPGSPVYGSLTEGDSIVPTEVSERFYSQAEIAAALTAAGLRLLATHGQSETETEIRLDPVPDEDRDQKLVYVAAG